MVCTGVYLSVLLWLAGIRSRALQLVYAVLLLAVIYVRSLRLVRVWGSTAGILRPAESVAGLSVIRKEHPQAYPWFDWVLVRPLRFSCCRLFGCCRVTSRKSARALQRS